MRSFRRIALTALVTFSAFGAITYSSCSKDECKDVVCANGGTCNETDGSCTCATGYNGTTCQTVAFLGKWTGSDACGSGTYTVNVTIDESSTDVTKVLVTNIGGFGPTVVVTGILSSDSKTVTFTNQDVTGGRTLTGSMTLTSNSAFTFSYTVTPTVGLVDNCNGSYTRQ